MITWSGRSTGSSHHHLLIIAQVFHYLSLALLTFFMVELAGKIYAYRLDFFKHKFEVFDGIVVVVSFVLDVVYISSEDAFDGVGLLILFRLWRVARIVNGEPLPDLGDDGMRRMC